VKILHKVKKEMEEKSFDKIAHAEVHRTLRRNKFLKGLGR